MMHDNDSHCPRVKPLVASTLLALWCVAPLLPAQAKEPGKDPAAVAGAMVSLLAEHGVTLDPKARTIAIDGVVHRPSDLLEYVLIHRRGKGHEAMLVTEVKASWLNAALLALGYTQGTNASTKDKDPMPSEEELRQGIPPFDVVPPTGQRIYITVSFQEPPKDGADDGDKADSAREAGTADPTKKAEEPEIKSFAIEDLLLDIHTGAPVIDAEFLYLGGRMAPLNRGEPEVFMADYEGNLVSCCYMLPGNHLVTIRHIRGTDEQNWWMSSFTPPPGTKVRITFHKDQPKEYEGREVRAREIAARVAKERAEYEREQARKQEAEKQAGGNPPGKKEPEKKEPWK